MSQQVVLDREYDCLAPFCRGRTLGFGQIGSRALPGVETRGWDSVDQGNGFESLASVEDGSVDNVVVVFALERCFDPVAALSEWARVLKERGRLAMVLRFVGPEEVNPDRHAFSPQYLVSIINRVAGLQITRLDEVPGSNSWVAVAENDSTAGVRVPLGSMGRQFAILAQKNPEARAELYFQIGMIFLQSGDPWVAETCFRKQLELDPTSSDAMFGLGMAFGGQGQWGAALTELQRVAALDSKNEEVRRWLSVAQGRVKAEAALEAQP